MTLISTVIIYEEVNPATTLLLIACIMCAGCTIMILSWSFESGFDIGPTIMIVILASLSVFCGIKFANREMHDVTECYYQIDDTTPYKEIEDNYIVLERHGDLILVREKETVSDEP